MDEPTEFLARCSDAYPFIGFTNEPGYLSPFCCDSCHEDEELGYPLSEVELPNGQAAEVCCRVRIALSGLVHRT